MSEITAGRLGWVCQRLNTFLRLYPFDHCGDSQNGKAEEQQPEAENAKCHKIAQEANDAQGDSDPPRDILWCR